MDLSLLRDIRPLIIEDESDAMNSMFSIFDTVFDIFYTARNGEEWLYRFYKDTPDVIITDLQMPFMSGFRMLDRIRMENKNIPIIVTSAHGHKEHVEKADDLNVNAYLIKPYDMNILFEKIYECCYINTLSKIDLDQFTV